MRGEAALAQTVYWDLWAEHRGRKLRVSKLAREYWLM